MQQRVVRQVGGAADPELARDPEPVLRRLGRPELERSVIEAGPDRQRLRGRGVGDRIRVEVGAGPGAVNDAAMLKMTSPFWIATTRRAEKECPSRSRSTWKRVGRSGLPARRKYPCSECGRRPSGTVFPATYRACAATWPPKSRARGPSTITQDRYRFSSMNSRSSRSRIDGRSPTSCPSMAPVRSSSSASGWSAPGTAS